MSILIIILFNNFIGFYNSAFIFVCRGLAPKCVIELSEKVLTSADRLRCTLIHEMCHAAVWMFNGDTKCVHGPAWKAW